MSMEILFFIFSFSFCLADAEGGVVEEDLNFGIIFDGGVELFSRITCLL